MHSCSNIASELQVFTRLRRENLPRCTAARRYVATSDVLATMTSFRLKQFSKQVERDKNKQITRQHSYHRNILLGTGRG